MFKKLKKFTIQMIAGANMATVIIMLLVGFSDRLNPADHPLLSTMGMTFPLFLLANLVFLFFWLMFKWRMIWIPVLGFVCAYVPISIYMPLNPKEDIPDGSLKLLSYNVCTYGGNYKYENGFEKVLEYLASEQPDIVCIQEDVDTRGRDTFKKYKKHWAYNDTLVLVNKVQALNALGIHTHYPIIKRERIEYDTETLANGSGAWWLKVGKDTLIVINNHFESCHLNGEDRMQYRQLIKGEMTRDSMQTESKDLLLKLADANDKRSEQIRAVMQYVEAHSQYPIVVCGDFNDNPLSYSCHTMREQLTDCFKETGRGIGLSYNQKAFAFRIDHIFCSQQLQPYNCRIDSKMDASDHNPILCWLKMV